MAVAQGYGKTVTSGSVFAYDTGDTRNSYTGRPTTNVSAGIGLNNYNNVPGNVTTAITATGGTYRGAAIYQQTITPLDASGVSYLTNGNNPGITTVILDSNLKISMTFLLSCGKIPSSNGLPYAFLTHPPSSLKPMFAPYLMISAISAKLRNLW